MRVCSNPKTPEPTQLNPASNPSTLDYVVPIPSTRASARESQTRSESKDDLSAVLSTEGRVVEPCWEKLKPTGTKGRSGVEQGGRDAAA